MIQNKAAFDYFLSNPLAEVDVKKFNEFCGVGVVVTPEQIKTNVSVYYLVLFAVYNILKYISNISKVTEVIESHKPELLEKRYKFNLGLLMSNLR